MRWRRVIATPLVLAVVLTIGPSAVSDERQRSEGSETPPQLAENAQQGKRKFRKFFNHPTIGDGCGASSAKGPRIRFFSEDLGSEQPSSDARISVGNTRFAVCLFGFEAGKTVTVDFAWPDGTVTHATDVVPYGGLDAAVVGFDPLPGMPLGRYELTARQGSVAATGSVTVERPRHPWLGVAAGRRWIGDRIRLVLAGFEANQQVRVAVYRSSDRARCPGQRLRRGRAAPYCLTTRRYRFQVDLTGDALVTLRLRRDHYRPNSYLFATPTPRVVTSEVVSICPRGVRDFYCFD
jgi:hypothetical protein